jgi:murein DD-endopeptidase MepM/ murein hydrolase activator NlpD
MYLGMTSCRVRLVVLGAMIFAALGRPSFAEQTSPVPENDPLYMRVIASTWPSEAAILVGNGGKHSAYELYVTNLGKTPLKIVELTVQGKKDDEVVMTQSATGKQLAAMFVPGSGDGSKPNGPILQPSEAGIFFIFADFAQGHAEPDSLDTAIRIEQHGERSGSGTIQAAELDINPAAPIAIQSPLRGKNWSAGNGPSNISSHRRIIIPVNGQPHIGQRYAIDWIQLGDDGNSFSGDKHKNGSYHAWDQTVRAVMEGKIVEVKDGIAENVPNSGKLAIAMTSDTIAGNHVIEDLGDGRYAAYAHLRPGTLKVKVGDTVHAGDVIGHLGNSGNSSEPHLHFQVCDAPSFFESEGIPFAIDKFTREDFKIDNAKGHPALIVKSSHPVTREEPMEDELDSFAP